MTFVAGKFIESDADPRTNIESGTFAQVIVNAAATVGALPLT